MRVRRATCKPCFWLQRVGGTPGHYPRPPPELESWWMGLGQIDRGRSATWISLDPLIEHTPTAPTVCQHAPQLGSATPMQLNGLKLELVMTLSPSSRYHPSAG